MKQGAFQNCFKLTNIDIPPSAKIEKDAFNKCPLNDRTIQCISNRFTNSLTLTDSFQNGNGPTLGFLGKTQKGYGPELWGITLNQIKHLLNHPLIGYDTTMREVVKLVIKPATKRLGGVGYALLINQDKPLKAKVMVSHAWWEEEIGQFIDCMENSGEEGPFWVCAFAIYQSDSDGDGPTVAEQLGPKPEYGPFSIVLLVAELMIAIFTETCDIYTRSWCVYEMSEAQKLGRKVRLCPHIQDSPIIKGLLDLDDCIRNIDSIVDSEKADCSWESDKKLINAAIKSNWTNGFNDINTSVEKIRLQYLLDYPVHKITGCCSENSDDEKEERRRKAVEEFLVPSIMKMISRVHSISADEILNFEDYGKSQPGISETIELFCEWKKLVENRIEER